MKNYIISFLSILFFQLNFGQINDKKLLLNYPKYDIVLKYSNDFNNDSINDILYILSPQKENTESLINNNDSVSKRKTIIYLGKKKNIFSKVFESDNIFPCRECLGKSDNYISDLKFENNILNYATTIAPFASDKYSVIDFTLQFVNNDFSIYQYKETYSSVEADDNVSITLDSKDVSKMKFNYYDWIADKSWIDYVTISSHNLAKINDFAYKLEKINPSVAINILNKILQKYPNRTVAYLNLADSYWTIGNEDLAKENYKKYVELMKSQKKDLKKIPKEVWERTK
jgi:tetratricopeptide (TPR) repeat protein